MSTRITIAALAVCALGLAIAAYCGQDSRCPLGSTTGTQAAVVKEQVSHERGEVSAEIDAAEREPFFDGLGTYRRTVSTVEPLTQKYFDQGLAFLYSFNHAEAERSFDAAVRDDPNCAIAYWGVAMARGPYINNMEVDEDDSGVALKSLRKARDLLVGATRVEQMLIRAAEMRYSDPPPSTREALDVAYAAAMRDVWKSFPDDPDVGALTAEAILNLRPWNQWTRDGKPKPGTEEATAILNAVLAKSPKHPFALHLFIHAVEASSHPERARSAADGLRTSAPGLEHLLHMPSHIDIRCGDWNAAVVANERALAADVRYREMAPDTEPYALSIAHDQHMLAYAAAMQGQMQKATRTVEELLSGMPTGFAAERAELIDGYVGMRYEFQARFGQWGAILKEPPPPKCFPIAKAIWHLARGVSFAASNRIQNAKTEQEAFSIAVKAIPSDARFRRNTARSLMAIGRQMLAGEICYRDNQLEQGIAALKEAVRFEDGLPYTEPPNWILHARHALGATLIDAGRFSEAETTYRDDLKCHPENGWALYGLYRSLEMQKKAEAATIQGRFERAWQHADFRISSSCCCLPGKREPMPK